MLSEEKNCQPKVLYPRKIYFKMKVEMLLDKGWEKSITRRHALKEMFFKHKENSRSKFGPTQDNEEMQ